MSDTPTLSEFNPKLIPTQYKVIKDIREKYDYSKGVHEVLLSGSVGSSKSLLMAHIVVTHCLKWKNARFCIGRNALPDLKATLYQTIKEHLDGSLIEGRDYKCNDTSAHIHFSNGSEILSRSWADRKFSKVRSLKLSGCAIEELTENDTDEAYTELSMRVNRLPHVPEQIMISASNPDSPAHWVYKRFMETESPTRHVYYSVTSDNPFLPASYIEKLKADLDPKMVQRMIYGQWIDIAGETIYYQYSRELHFRNSDYEINPAYPVHFSFDFNIGHGKPLSVVFFQYVDDVYHFFDEVVVEGLRTAEAMQEAYDRKLFAYDVPVYFVHGDATGSARTTASNYSNYELITQFLDAHNIKYKYAVLKSNPPIKTRHNLVNAFLQNSLGAVRIQIYKKTKTLAEGFSQVKLKRGASYIEDDSLASQHITTAAGYGIYYCNLMKERGQSVTIQL